MTGPTPELPEHYGDECREHHIMLIDDDIEAFFPAPTLGGRPPSGSAGVRAPRPPGAWLKSLADSHGPSAAAVVRSFRVVSSP
jgi:hypothetical protein